MTPLNLILYLAALLVWATYCGYYRHSHRRFLLGVAAIATVTVRIVL